jgi:hypothetical protein
MCLIFNSLLGTCIDFDTNMIFRQNSFACIGYLSFDSGAWSIKSNHLLVIKSAKKNLNFELVQFDVFSFFIQPAQRLEFTHSLRRIKNKIAKSVYSKIADTNCKKNYYIAIELNEKYFGYFISSGSCR